MSGMIFKIFTHKIESWLVVTRVGRNPPAKFIKDMQLY